jgi:hypothetical protein
MYTHEHERPMLGRLQNAYDTVKRRTKPKHSNSITRVPMSEERMVDLIKDRFGEGRDEQYRPWIRVTRSVSSPRSHVNIHATPVHQRGIHLLSKLERTASYVACWLGATEIREQFPLFPWRGRHPMAGLDRGRDGSIKQAPALLEIAEEAGIDIGWYVGTAIPFVATVDLVLRFGQFPDDRLVFWSVKPESELLHPKHGLRVRERLELERRYAKAVGATHAVFTDEHVNDHLRKNLIWLTPCLEHLAKNPPASRAPFLACYAEQGDDMPLNRRMAQIAVQLQMQLADVVAHFRTAAWLGEIDIDLTAPLTMAYPARRDVRQRKAALRTQLLGGL